MIFLFHFSDDSRSSIGMGNRQFQSHINFSPEEGEEEKSENDLVFKTRN